MDSRARMADFEEYAEIISRAIGHKPNEFIEAYRKNRKIQADVVIEGSLIATALIKLLDEPSYKGNTGWSGRTTELLTELELYADRFKINTKDKSWPRSPNALSSRLGRIKTSLRDLGIEISYTKDTRTRVKVWKIIRPVKDRSDRSDRSEDGNRAQNEAKNANDVTNDHTDTNERSFGENTENRAQNRDCERSNDVNDVIRVSSTDKSRKEQRPYSDYLVNGIPIWQKENRGMTQEEEQAFRNEVERLKSSKVADMAEANLSWNGIM